MKKKNSYLSLRLKATISIVILVAIVASILSVIFISHERQVIHQDLRQRGKVMASNLAYNAEYGVLVANKSILKGLIGGIMRQPDMAFCWIQDKRQEILAGEGILPKINQWIAETPVLESVDEIQVRYIQTAEGPEYYDFFVPIVSQVDEVASDESGLFLNDHEWTGIEDDSENGQDNVRVLAGVKTDQIGHIHIGLSLEAANLLIKTSQRRVMMITALIISIAALITTISTGLAVKPIRQLVEGTQRIVTGDLDFKVPIQFRDEIGQLAESFNVMTEHLKNSQDELMRAKDYTDNIIKSLNDMLIVMDGNGMIKSVNPSTEVTLGFDEQALIGKSMFLILGKDSGFYRDIIPNLLKAGFAENVEVSYKKRNGDLLPVLFSGAVMRSERDELEGIVTIAKDITERIKTEKIIAEKNVKLQEINTNLQTNEKALKNMLTDLTEANEKLKKTQTQLVHSEKLASIGQLAAGVAHEINNPLGFVNSNISTLQEYMDHVKEIYQNVEILKLAVEKKDLDKALKTKTQLTQLEQEYNFCYIMNDVPELLKETENGVIRISTIVKDLRTFARADSDESSSSNINEILDGVLNILWNEIKFKVEIVKAYQENLPLINCNAQRMGQVFMNIIVNAAQAVEEKGIIKVRTFSRNNEVYAEIEDNGPGIPDAVKAKIFDPFFTTKDVGKGTGLGLSISFELVKKSGGQIFVISEIGKGTTFQVVFPCITKNKES